MRIWSLWYNIRFRIILFRGAFLHIEPRTQFEKIVQGPKGKNEGSVSGRLQIYDFPVNLSRQMFSHSEPQTLVHFFRLRGRYEKLGEGPGACGTLYDFEQSCQGYHFCT